MFRNKNAANQVSVFRKLVRLRYQDGSIMAEHMNAFQGLIHQATSLEVPLANEVLALFLLGSLPDSWETLVVTLGTARPEGKRLSLARVKSSLLDEEARRKDKDTASTPKCSLPNRNAEDKETVVPRTGNSQRHGQSQGGGPLASIVASQDTSRRTVGTSERTRKPTIPIRSRHWTETVKTEGGRTERERQQSRQVKKSCCSSSRRVS